MNGIARIADALVARAASRWPADLRDGMREEWTAELATLRAESRLGAVSRGYRQIAFSLSLAFARSGLHRDPIAGGWRRHLPAGARAAQRFGVIVGVAALAWVLTWGMTDLSNQLTTFNNVSADPSVWRQAVTAVATQLLGLVLMAIVGAMVARRIGSADPGSGVWARAGAIVVPVGVAAYVVYLANSGPTDRTSGGDPYPTEGGAAIVVWTVIMVAAMAVAYRFVTAGKRRSAWAAAAIGSLVAADVAGIVASLRAASAIAVPVIVRPAAFLLAYLPVGVVRVGHVVPVDSFVIGGRFLDVNSVSFTSDIVVGAAGIVTVPLLACSAFVAAYGLWQRRADGAAAITNPRERTPTVPIPPAIRVVGAGAVAAGLGLWAATCSTPALGLGPYLDTAFQVRIGGILLAVMGLCGLVVGRGSVALSATAGAMVLFGLDVGVARAHWSGAGVGIAAFVVGAVALATCAAVAGRLAGSATTGTAARRSLFAFSVIGVLALPTNVSVSDIFANHALIHDGGGVAYPPWPPASLALRMVVLSVLLLTVAVVYAFASRGSRLTPVATRALSIIAIGVFAVGIVDGMAVQRALYWPMSMFFVQPVLAVVVIAIAMWRPGQNPLRAPLSWFGVGIAAAVTSVVLTRAVTDIGFLASSAVVSAEYGRLGPWAGDTMGGVALGLVVALIVQRWAVPTAEPVLPNASTEPDAIGGGAAPGSPQIRPVTA